MCQIVHGQNGLFVMARGKDDTDAWAGFDLQMAGLLPLLPELFIQDSDRAAVLVVVCLVESSLKQLLKKYFQHASDSSDADCEFLLGKPPAPVGSSSVKARLAFSLGLIDRDELAAVRRLLEVRNAFAHQKAPHPITADLADGLISRIPAEAKKALGKVIAAMEGAVEEIRGKRNPRTRFITASIMVWHVLEMEGRILDDKAKKGLILRRLPVLIRRPNGSRKKKG